MRLVALGVRLRETRVCAVALRLQRLDLPLRHVERLLARSRVPPAAVAAATSTAARSERCPSRSAPDPGSALACCWANDQRRLRLVDLRFVGGDLGLLHVDLRVDVLDAGLRAPATCASCLIQRDAVITLVDARDHVAGGDVLVVGHRHRRDVARHLRRDGELPRRDEGVVGRFEMPGVVPIDIAARRRHDEEDEPNQKPKRAAPQERPARLIPALPILLHMLIFAFGRCFNDAALARGMLSRRRRSSAGNLLLRAHGRLVVADHLARGDSG